MSFRGGLYTINGRQVHGNGTAPLTPPSSRPTPMSTIITTTVHLYPGTPRERLVKVEAAVSLFYGRYRIDRLNPLEGGTIGAHELDAAYDAVIDAAHAYHGSTIPDGAREGGFTVIELFVTIIILALLAILIAGVSNARFPRPPDALISQSTSQSLSAPVLYTLKHDNHLFIANNDAQTLLHHPDCPCVKSPSRTEVEQVKALGISTPQK